MSDFEEDKRMTTQAFGQALRQSELAAKVDVQRLVMAVGRVVDELSPGETFDLTDLYQFLLSQELEAKPVAELLVYLKSREDQLKIPMALPADMASLSAEAQALIVERFKRTASEAAIKREVSNPRGVVPPPGVPDRPKTMFDNMKGKDAHIKAGPNPMLYVGLAAAVVVAVSVFAMGRGEPANQNVAYVDDPAGVGCSRVIGGKNGAVCDLPTTVFDSMDADEFKTRAQITVKKLQGMGYERVVIRTAEDLRVRPY